MTSSPYSTSFKRKVTALAVLFLLLCTFVAPAAADYSESGISLHTVAHDKIHGAASVTGGHGLAASPYSQSFSVPDGNVRFARLYVGVWGGTPDNQGTLDTSLNGASLGSRTLGGSSDSNGMTYVSGFGVHWAAYDATGSVHSGSNSASATTGGDIDGRVYGIVLAVAVENQADPEIEYWFAEGCDNLNAAESKDYASVDFGSGPTPASVTDAELYATYIASMSGDGDQLQLNGQTIATDAASGSSGSYFDMHKYSVKNLIGDSNSVSFSRGGANRLHPAFAGLVTTVDVPQTETPTPTGTTPDATPTATVTETTQTTATAVPVSSTTTAEPTTQAPTTGPTSTNTPAVPTGTTVTATATSPTETAVTTGTTTTVTATTTTQSTTVTATTTQPVSTVTPSVTTTKNPEPTVSVPIQSTLFPANVQTSAPTQAVTSSSQVQSPTSAAGTVASPAPIQSTSSTDSSSSPSGGAVSTGDSSSGSSSDDYTGVGGEVGTTATTAHTTTPTQTQSSASTPTPTPGNTSTPLMTTPTPPFLDTGSQNEYSPLTIPGSSSSKSSSGDKNSQKNFLSTLQSTVERLTSSDLSLLLLVGAGILFILLVFAGLIILVLFLLLLLIAYLYLQQRNNLQKKD